jgi:hypothetical protein
MPRKITDQIDPRMLAKEEFMLEVGEVFYAARVEAKLSYRKIAKLSGVDESVVLRLFNSKRASPFSIAAIAKGMGLRPRLVLEKIE